MKGKKKTPPRPGTEGWASDLETLRKLCGQPLPTDSSSSYEQQVRPGLWRKVYLPAPQQRYQIRAAFKHLPIKLLPSEDIAARIDNRTTLQLKEEQDKVTGQIFVRAVAGNLSAIFMLPDLAQGIVEALEKVEQAQPKLLRFAAEKSHNWPVVLSPNPQDIDAARDRVKRLKVGSKADTPRREGQRVDPRNFWTRLADDAFSECRTCMVFVPKLQSLCLGVKPHRQRRKAWRTEMPANIYPVSPPMKSSFQIGKRRAQSFPCPLQRRTS